MTGGVFEVVRGGEGVSSEDYKFRRDGDLFDNLTVTPVPYGPVGEQA
jgi:hypothetical protein